MPPYNEEKGDLLSPHTPTYATPIHYSIASPPKMITSEYLPQRLHPKKKKKALQGAFKPLNTFPRERHNSGPPQSIIVRKHIKLPIFFPSPPH